MFTVIGLDIVILVRCGSGRQPPDYRRACYVRIGSFHYHHRSSYRKLRLCLVFVVLII